MWTQAAVAVGVLALLTMVPGPDMAVVTQRAIGGGAAQALRAAAGVVTGLLVWGASAVAGLAAILASSAQAYLVIRIFGAAYLIFLGLRALWAGRGSAPGRPLRPGGASGADSTDGPGKAYWTGLVTNLLNPKIAVFYVGLLPALAPSGLPVAVGLCLLVLVHALLSFAWLGGYAYLLCKARSVFERPRVRRALSRVTGVVLIGFGLRLAVEAH